MEAIFRPIYREHTSFLLVVSWCLLFERGSIRRVINEDLDYFVNGIVCNEKFQALALMYY